MTKEKITVVMDYRTRDGLADYGFSIEFQTKEGWRVYTIFQPLHQGDDDHSQCPYPGPYLGPYLATDHDGRPYVDWSARLDNLGDAKTVAALWAEISHQRF